MTTSTEVAPDPAALVCRGLRVAFRGREVLGGIDVDLAAGEWLGLIGPNGAGKSTLLRAIVGLVDHDGTVALADGRTPAATDVALVPQAPVLPLGMTVAEYVLLGRTAHMGWLARESRADRSIVATTLRRLDLDRFAGHQVASLSGGEAQRVVVARALAQQAPLLLLDEPTSALDLGHQTAVLELVDDLRRSDGLAIVSAMHDLTTAARFADRLALINMGRMVAEGPPDVVLRADRLSQIYTTPLTVRTIDHELVVLPAPRTAIQGQRPTSNQSAPRNEATYERDELQRVAPSPEVAPGW